VCIHICVCVFVQYTNREYANREQISVCVCVYICLCVCVCACVKNGLRIRSIKVEKGIYVLVYGIYIYSTL
jgi:hypothetical protein